VAGARRFGLLLTLLLVLVGAGAPAMAATQAPRSVGATVSAARTTYDDRQDRPRGSVTAGHVHSTASPDTWWVVCQRPSGSGVPHGWSPGGAVSRTAIAGTAPTSRSSRAPPSVR
jgi:hypothetical protein